MEPEVHPIIRNLSCLFACTPLHFLKSRDWTFPIKIPDQVGDKRQELYVFSNSLTLPDVSLCHSRFSLSVIPDIFNRESRVLFQADPHP